MTKPWIQWFAGATLLAFIAGVLRGYPIISNTLAAVSLVLFVISGTVGIIEYRRASDPYSLETLRRIHIGEAYAEIDEADMPEIDETSDMVCINCGRVYGAKLLICPIVIAGASAARCGAAHQGIAGVSLALLMEANLEKSDSQNSPLRTMIQDP